MLKKILMTALVATTMIGSAFGSTFAQVSNASYELYRDGTAICSGQFVTDTEYLTAAHCLADSAKHKYSIKTIKDGAVVWYQLNVNHIAPNYDTGTLVLADKEASFPHADVAPQDYKIIPGSPVLLAGYPDVEDYFYAVQGLLNSEVPMYPRFGIPDGQSQYSVSGWAIPGSSGSGLYVTINGEYYLIGTMHGGPNDVMNFTSTLEGVRTVL